MATRAQEVVNVARELLKVMDLDLAGVDALIYALDNHAALRELVGGSVSAKRKSEEDNDEHIRKRRLLAMAMQQQLVQPTSSEGEHLDPRDTHAVIAMQQMIAQGWSEDKILRSDVDKLTQPSTVTSNPTASDETLSEATLENDIPGADFSMLVRLAEDETTST